MKSRKVIIWSIRFTALLLLFYIFFISGTLALSGLLPDIKPEPGPIPNQIAFLIVGICNTLLVIGLILSSYWNGWKLSLILAFSYYGAVTFLPQIETWYFLSNITVSEKLMFRLFIMGLPVAFIYVPLSVWIVGKFKPSEKSKQSSKPSMPIKQWAWKLGLIAFVYVVLYWTAGYFIAWQNPELRAFYDSPGKIISFWEHTANTITNDSGLLPFQILRSMLWTLCALPIIRGSKLSLFWTCMLMGLFLTIPQVLGLILENPLMPSASVRQSHMIEGFSSNFIFAVIITLLFYRKNIPTKDLN